jgi:hypothetical protein
VYAAASRFEQRVAAILHATFLSRTFCGTYAPIAPAIRLGRSSLELGGTDFRGNSEPVARSTKRTCAQRETFVCTPLLRVSRALATAMQAGVRTGMHSLERLTSLSGASLKVAAWHTRERLFAGAQCAYSDPQKRWNPASGLPAGVCRPFGLCRQLILVHRQAPVLPARLRTKGIRGATRAPSQLGPHATSDPSVDARCELAALQPLCAAAL